MQPILLDMSVLGFREIAVVSRRFLVLIVGVVVVLVIATPYTEGRAYLAQRHITLKPSGKKVRLDLVVSESKRPNLFLLQMYLYQRQDQKYERVDMALITTNYRKNSELDRFDVRQSTVPNQGKATVKYKISDNDTPRSSRLYFTYNFFK